MRRKDLAAAVLLAGLTAAAYLPVARAGFIWDDAAHVTENPALHDLHGLVAIWTTLDATPQYYPLTHTTFWIEYHLWGLDPRGYHAVNVLLHALSAILFWRLLVLLEVPSALVAAMVFAVHPVHVESVAWVTERKNTLSGFLALGAALVFLKASLRHEPGVRPRLLSAILYALALLAKTVTSTLPVVLGVALWWKRSRLDRRDILWLVAMTATGAVAGSITRHLETAQLHASGADWAMTVPDRLALAGRIPWFYAGKLVWPAGLVFIYPRWSIDAADPSAWVWTIAGIVTAAALFLTRERFGRGPFAAVFAFVVTLGPALGFFDVYPMRYSFVADHFQYLASLPLIALACSGAGALVARAALLRPWARSAAILAGAVLIGALGARSYARCRVFRDEETLWRDTLEKNPSAWIAHNDLGILLARRGAYASAAQQFRAVVAIKPDHAGAWANLGYALEIEGDDESASRALASAIAASPADGHAESHLARCLLRLGRVDDALPHAIAAARLLPDDPEAACDAGSLLARAGRFDEGIAELERALSLRPDLARARVNLEVARRQRNGVSSGAPSTNRPTEASR